MKKDNILKWIGIFFVGYIILTWLIPTGYVSNGEFVKGATEPIGLLDVVKLPVITLTSSVLLLYAVIILAIAGFYGVMNKIGAYKKLINTVVAKFKTQSNKFLIATTILFIILSSLTGLNWLLFVLVPFFITILMSLKNNKITTFMATFGAILIGNIGSLYGFNIAGYSKYFFNYDINAEILFKLLFTIIISVVYVFLILKSSKQEPVKEEKKVKKSKKTEEEPKKEEKIIIPLYDNKVKANKKSFVPYIIIFGFMFVVLVMGLYNWYIAFNFDKFTELHTTINDIKINNYPIVMNILGSFEELGYWTNYDVVSLLIIATVLIAWVYKVSMKDFVDGFTSGVKEMFPVAVYAILANLVFLAVNTSSTGMSIFPTISNFIFGLAKEFNIILLGISTIFGSLIYNDFPYLVNSLIGQINANYTNTNFYPLVAFIIQVISGLMYLILPVSVFLIAGLKYLNISLKEWFKTIWKYVLIVLGIAIVIFALIYFV